MNHQGRRSITAKAAFFRSLLVLASTLLAQPGLAASAAPPSNEKADRAIDAAALAAQGRAISKLESLLGRARDTAEEALFLQRLAGLYYESSTLLFRLSHGHGGKYQAKHRESLQKTIASVDRLLARFPRLPYAHTPLSLRARAYDDLGLKEKAKADYLDLVTRFPESPESSAARMALAGYAADAGAHAEAVQHLLAVEARPYDPHFPFALYRLAWARFNLGQVTDALTQLERHADYYAERAKSDPQGELPPSELAFVENGVNDYALFYLEGFEKKQSCCRLETTLKRFRERSEASPLSPRPLGRLAQRFARLLKAHGHEEALVAWRDQLIEDEPKLPETTEVILATIDYQVEKNRPLEFSAAAAALAKLHSKSPIAETSPEIHGKALASVAQLAKTLDTLVLKNKAATEEVKPLADTLAGVYRTWIALLDQKDPRVAAAHHNLAETLFAIRDFEGAAAHYRLVPEDRIRAIAARYETLRATGAIPKSLEAHATNGDESDDSAPGAKLKEWLQWIDEATHVALESGADKPLPEELAGFRFETNRALYAAGAVAQATRRMKEDSLRDPKSKFSVAGASLALDTEILTQRWSEVLDFARRTLKADAPWSGKEEVDLTFRQKNREIAAGAGFKLCEAKAEDTAAQISCGQSLIAEFPDSKAVPETLFMIARAEKSQGQTEKAREHLTTLIERHQSLPALAARATIAEENLDFDLLVADTTRLFEAGAGKDPKARARLLHLLWLTRKLGAPELRHLGCGVADADASCEPYLSLARASGAAVGLGPIVLPSADSPATKTARLLVRLMVHNAAPAPARPRDRFRHTERMELIETLAALWPKLDRDTALYLSESTLRAVILAFERSAAEFEGLQPLNPEANVESAIVWRMGKIDEIKDHAAKILSKAPELAPAAGRLTLTLSKHLASLGAAIARIETPASLPSDEKAKFSQMLAKLSAPFVQKAGETEKNAAKANDQLLARALELEKRALTLKAENEAKATAASEKSKAHPSERETRFVALFQTHLKSANWPMSMHLLGIARSWAPDRQEELEAEVENRFFATSMRTVEEVGSSTQANALALSH